MSENLFSLMGYFGGRRFFRSGGADELPFFSSLIKGEEMQVLSLHEIEAVSGGEDIPTIVVTANRMTQEEKDDYDWDNSWYGSLINSVLKAILDPNDQFEETP